MHGLMDGWILIQSRNTKDLTAFDQRSWADFKRGFSGADQDRYVLEYGSPVRKTEQLVDMRNTVENDE